MTNEEAKTNLEKLLLLYDDGMIDFSIIRESIKVAIEALEKQIPKKPVDNVDPENSDLYRLDCPTCGRYVGYRAKGVQHTWRASVSIRCELCGQAIDWTEVEE